MQNKNVRKMPGRAIKTQANPQKTKKKKSTAYKPKPWLMVIYWILGLLMLVFAYMKVKHFFSVHW